jgi:hypothetical protein
MGGTLTLTRELEFGYLFPSGLEVLNQPFRRPSGTSLQRRATVLEHVPPYGPRTHERPKNTDHRFVRCRFWLLPVVIAAERLATTYSAE